MSRTKYFGYWSWRAMFFRSLRRAWPVSLLLAIPAIILLILSVGR